MTAITLRISERAEADRYADVLTREYGKIRLILPGVRRIQAKLATAVEPLRESSLIAYSPGQPEMFPEGAKLVGAELLAGNWYFLQSTERYLWAMYLAEITAALLGYYLANQRQYELFRRTLQLLKETTNYWRLADGYLLRLTASLGYNFWEYIVRSGHTLTDRSALIKNYQTLPGVDLLAMPEEILPRELDKKIFTKINEYLQPHLWYQLKSLDIIYENFSGNNF